MDERRAKAAISALQALRDAAEDSSDAYDTKAFNGWIRKIGEAFEDKLEHLELPEPTVEAGVLITAIDMAVAYAEQMLEDH